MTTTEWTQIAMTPIDMAFVGVLMWKTRKRSKARHADHLAYMAKLRANTDRH